MYLAYIDDSGSDKANPVVVMGAVIVPDKVFWKLDMSSGSIAQFLLPYEKQDTFVEFKAAELLGGYGVFHGVDETIRHSIVRALLVNVERFNLPFVYAAVDKRALDASAFGSSLAMDVAFRICACGVEDWITQDTREKLIREGHDTDIDRARAFIENPYLLITDDTDDKPLKIALRKSFRELRPLSHTKESDGARLFLCHDDMYFGDSKSSIGIQLADLCAHVMLRKFRDGIQDEFYQAVVKRAICAKPSPFWEHCHGIMKNHEDDAPSAALPFSLADLARLGASEPKALSEGQP